MLLLLLFIGCNDKGNLNNKVASEKPGIKSNTLLGEVTNIYNDSWKMMGHEIKGFTVKVHFKDMKLRQMNPSKFIWEVNDAVDNLGNRYQYAGVKISKVYPRGTFVIDQQFTPQINPKAKFIDVKLKFQPTFKIGEARLQNLNLNSKSVKSKENIKLELIKKGNEDNDIKINLVEKKDDFLERYISEETYLLTKRGKKLPIRSIGSSDPINKQGDIRYELGFSLPELKETFDLVIIWHPALVSWEYDFKGLVVNGKFEDIDNNQSSNYKFMSISDMKKEREITDEKIIQEFIREMNSLELSISKEDQNVINMRDYWIMLRDTKDPSKAKYSCLISPDKNRIMINSKVYDIQGGSVDFKKYLNR